MNDNFGASSRRELFIAAAGIAAAAGLPSAAAAAGMSSGMSGGSKMLAVADGTKIY